MVYQVYAVNVIYPNDEKCIDTKKLRQERIVLKAVNHSEPNRMSINQTEEIELKSDFKPNINQTYTNVLTYSKKITNDNVVLFKRNSPDQDLGAANND